MIEVLNFMMSGFFIFCGYFMIFCVLGYFICTILNGILKTVVILIRGYPPYSKKDSLEDLCDIEEEG